LTSTVQTRRPRRRFCVTLLKSNKIKNNLIFWIPASLSAMSSRPNGAGMTTTTTLTSPTQSS
ncbi:MAG: hypothetical protein AAB657_00205, partial [Patescibacteria group bacterium]